jgi:hypothetical protein
MSGLLQAAVAVFAISSGSVGFSSDARGSAMLPWQWLLFIRTKAISPVRMPEPRSDSVSFQVEI